MATISDDFLTLDDPNLQAIDIREGTYTPDTPEDTMQLQIASAPQIDGNTNATRNTVLCEKVRALKLEKRAAETITTMDLDPGNAGCLFPPLDSLMDMSFNFDPGLEIDSVLAGVDFPTDGCRVPNFTSIYKNPTTTEHDHMHSPFYADTVQDTLSELNRITSNNIGEIYDSSFASQSWDQGPLSGENIPQSLGNGRPNLDEHGSTISPSLSSESTISPTKRRQKGSFSEDYKDDGGENRRLIRRGRSSRDNSTKLFACPFHKKDPRRHQDCGRYTLSRIKDVKQHVYRLHCKPELYCSRCYKSFKRANQRDYHIREGGCPLNEPPNKCGDQYGIISGHQKKRLKDCGSRGTSKQQQWMEIWKVIFPGVNLPRSPHVDDQAELLSCLRGYWEDNASEIIARAFGNHKLDELDFVRTRDAVDIILDHFDTDATSWDIGTNTWMDKERQPFEDPLGNILNQPLPWELDHQLEIYSASPTMIGDSPFTF
ncbi:hypothetical protein F4825DRAFT_440960 [Nemania diffusa]|nr:hypothetical protein F4825DRAFT_440960 [Nemania diffusa]